MPRGQANALSASLRSGSHGEAVSTLQSHLRELGHLNAMPDGDFGPATRAAVQAFQRGHGLNADGIAGPATLTALKADIQTLAQHSPAPFPSMLNTAAPGQDDPRNLTHAAHGLYNELQRRIPDASDDRLVQFTAACHMNRITRNGLDAIHLDESTHTISFAASWPPGPVAQVDLTQPLPTPQQSMQQVHAYDQQQAQQMTQFHARQAQINAQQGPVMGAYGQGEPGF